MTRLALAAALGLAAFLSALDATAAGPTTTPAKPADSLEWTFPTFRPVEYVATGIVGAAAIGAYYLVKPRSTPNWTGGILFDDAVRDALRLRSPAALEAARTASNVTALSAVVLAVGVDSIGVPLVRHGTETAEQLTLIDAETFAVSSLVTTSAYDLVGRARPSYADCQRDPSFDRLCNSAPTTSFWSGHTAQAFTAAGLSCAHHAYEHIYGSPLADALGCTGMITLASATGTLRILGDRHYATDVLAAAIMGFGIGYGLPTLLHYTAPRQASANASAAITPMSRGVDFQFGVPF